MCNSSSSSYLYSTDTFWRILVLAQLGARIFTVPKNCVQNMYSEVKNIQYGSV